MTEQEPMVTTEVSKAGGGQVTVTTSEDPVPYVIQRKVEGPAEATWVDLVEVDVAKKTRTGRALLDALAKAKIVPTDADRFRVLNADAAQERQVRVKRPAEPEYEVI